MISKKLIMLLSGAFAVSFILSFVLSWAFGPEPAVTPQQTAAQTEGTEGGTEEADKTKQLLAALPAAGKGNIRLKEQQLNDLVRELRRKIRQNQQKEEDLEKRQARIQMTQEQLKAQAQELKNLQAQLVGPMNHLKETLAQIKQTQLVINKQELANLQQLATIYDKMDSASCSEVFTEMCTNNQMDDAVKLLRFMSEKKAAKVLAEIPDKSLVAKLSEKLKSVKVES